MTAERAYPSGELTLVQRWMSATSGKWALPILDRLVHGGARYNRLLEGLEPISPKVLTQTLRRLEIDGLVVCEHVGIYGRRYRLTECGAQVRGRLTTLRQLAGQMTATASGSSPQGPASLATVGAGAALPPTHEAARPS